MSSQVGAVSKGSSTVVTFEGFLPRVGSDVTLEEPRSRESLSAQLTLTGQGVGTNVHLQGTKRNVGLFAIFAVKLLFHLIHTMELFVL